jgi:DTW domain-containing protein
MNAPLVRRPVCALCLRPQATCLCHLVVPTASACELLILQHPLEVHHAKNSARLLHLSVPGSRIVVGEAFNEAALLALLPGPRTTVLLYPPTAYEWHAVPALLEPAQLVHPGTLRLVVLDATWRKSRKMLHLSPGLQRLRDPQGPCTGPALDPGGHLCGLGATGAQHRTLAAAAGSF